MLAFLAGQADRLIFGRLLPVATLGVYSIAVMFAAIPTQLVWTIGNLVLFPTFSRSAHSTGLLATTYRRVQRPVYVLGAFPVACLAAAGPPFIDALYDARYSDAGWMLQPLAFATWVQVLQTVSGAAILAMGDSRRQALGNGLKFAAMIGLVPAGFVFFGVWGGIWGLAVSELFRYAVLASGVRNHGLPGPQTDLAYSLLVAASVTAGLVTRALTGDDASAWLQLFASVGGVLLIWAPSAGWTLRREVARAVLEFRERRRTAPR
jgi:O-antigen/teichoic acid export membrane protein